MSDYYFNKFYKDIADPSWPRAENLTEFLKLPNEIQQECIQVHDLSNRLEQLEDKQYWRKLLSQSEVLRKHDVVYLPVYKCAHTYYSRLLEQQGWVKENLWDLDLTKLHAFGLIMHPLTRRLKGITQELAMSFDRDYSRAMEYVDSNPDFIKKISILESHTIPYSTMYGEKINQVNWIPLDLLSETEVNTHITKFCKLYNVEVEIQMLATGIVNKSTPEKLSLYNKIKDIFINYSGSHIELYLLYADDLKFYRNLTKQYT